MDKEKNSCNFCSVGDTCSAGCKKTSPQTVSDNFQEKMSTLMKTLKKAANDEPIGIKEYEVSKEFLESVIQLRPERSTEIESYLKALKDAYMKQVILKFM
ncbi:MAG: hypothetical protein LKI76_04015 [Megasphaera sp.]|jgi:hypothetical protein|uniref:hypothetical protein n=1 Tax=Megasphaera sueciensis TaxID=349094 RepID=UPI003CFD8AD0|nr:hypothetical protein [Megasphaera sp.]MCI1823088.1 hypothetical protein [Megasphaera sp.]